MVAPLSGPGLGLPPVQNLYPSELYNAPQDFGVGLITLEAAQAIAVPRGTWYINPGMYSAVQFLDPLNGLWRSVRPQRQVMFVGSDGFNCRIINLTGCIVGAVVTAEGSGYVAASTTIVPSVGNSTWQAIVGGALAVGSVTAPGAGFTIPPWVMIPSPPNTFNSSTAGSFQATGYASISSGTVSGVTMVNVGAGYVGATITGLLLPSPYDPNAAAITPGTVTFTTAASAGKLTGALCTDYGSALTPGSSGSLVVSGAGSGATLSQVILQTITAASVSAAGAGYGSGAPLITSAGGVNSAVDAVTNPDLSLTGFVPFPLQAAGVVASGSISSVTIEDSGLFTAAPSPIVVASDATPTTLATIAFTMGSKNDTIFIQPTG